MGPATGAQITKAPDACHRSQGKRPKSANQVMKNALKSVRRGSKSTTISQAKSKHYPAPDKLPDTIRHDQAKRLAAGTVTCVLTKPDGSEWVRVDFPRDLFAHIEDAAVGMGITLGQFFDNAIREAYKRRGIFATLEARPA